MTKTKSQFMAEIMEKKTCRQQSALRRKIAEHASSDIDHNDIQEAIETSISGAGRQLLKLSSRLTRREGATAWIV